MKNKLFPFLILLSQLLFPLILTGQSPYISSWSFAGIANGFDGSPNHQYFSVAEPEIKRLDPQGGELWFTVTSKSFPTCKQVFRVGWAFDRPVMTLTEGQTVQVQVFNWPVGDKGGVGYRECYQQGRQWAYDESFFTIHFRGGAYCHFHNRKDYAKYWGAQSPFLFVTEPAEGIVSYPVDPGFGAPVGLTTGSLFVKNGVKEVGDLNVPQGSFTIEISKGKAFRYNIIYLYEGKPGPKVAARTPLILEKPVVQHNIPNEDGIYFMQLSLPGSVQNSAGKSLRVVMRFCDADGKLLPAAPDEPTYRDQRGYVASASEPLIIPDNNFPLEELVVWMPYVALNLEKTGYVSHSLMVYAEVFLDGKSVGVSEKVLMDVLW
jgi:hypothetical protein